MKRRSGSFLTLHIQVQMDDCLNFPISRYADKSDDLRGMPLDECLSDLEIIAKQGRDESKCSRSEFGLCLSGLLILSTPNLHVKAPSA